MLVTVAAPWRCCLSAAKANGGAGTERERERERAEEASAGGRDKAPGQLYGLLTHKTENVITFAAGNVDGGNGSVAFEIRFNIVNCVQNFVI